MRLYMPIFMRENSSCSPQVFLNVTLYVKLLKILVLSSLVELCSHCHGILQKHGCLLPFKLYFSNIKTKLK